MLILMQILMACDDDENGDNQEYMTKEIWLSTTNIVVGVIKLVLCGIVGVLCGFATCSCDINFKNFKVVYFMIEMLVLVVVVKETEMVGDIYMVMVSSLWDGG